MAGLFPSPKKTQAKQRPAVSGLQIQTAAYGKVIPLVYGTTRIAPNLIWYGDFQAIAHQSSPPSAGKGGVAGGAGGKGGGAGSTTYTYTAAVMLGLCEGAIQGLGQAWASKEVTTPAALGLSVFTGAVGQAPWGYLSTNHPAQALGYSATAYAAAAPYALDGQGQLPNNNFEVIGLYANSVGVLPDADPSLVVADLLTNPRYGAGFPAARLGDLATYQSYALASGLLISPAYTEAASAAKLLDDIATYTNSAFVWSSGSLTLVPYGDAPLSGNGKSYTPPAAPLYDLTDDDFLPNSGAGGASASLTDDPVLVTRKRPSDALNDVKVEYLDRANRYNTAIVEASDQAMIDVYGLRFDQTRQAHLFADANAARLSAQLVLQRQAIRNTYQFTLDQRYVLLDPMDIVTLTDARLGLARQWVRITEITENDDGTLGFTAEDYLAGTGAAASYSFQQGAGYAANYNVDPGDALAPIVFEAPAQIASSGLEVWLATAGGPNWGGCDVYVSSDGSTYKLAGRKHGPSRMGVLTTAFPSGSDPDTADTLAVDLSASAGALLSGTQADADLGHTLCWVDSEFVSYETATLTGANRYALGTYIRRGLYGSAIASHAAGAGFARLDDSIFALPYDKGQIGTTVHIKLVSFNLYGGGLQQLASVTDYTHTILGPPPPANVTGFSAQQTGGAVVFKWNEVADFALKGYDILYGPQGGTIASAAFLTESARGTEMTNAAVPPGTWTFYIRARDVADQFSASPTTVALVVTNPDPVILDEQFSPGWAGTLLGFVAHWSGVLVPDSTKLASAHTDAELFEQFVPFPVASSSFTAAAADTGFDDSLRVWAAIATVLGRGQTGTPEAGLAIDTWLTGASDPGTFTAWTIGTVTMRYLRGQAVLTNVAGAVACLAGFELVADRAPKIENSAASVAVAAGGTAIVFPSPYHLPPNVQATALGASAVTATAADIATTGCTLHVFDHTGADIGGSASWIATGE
ncbi:MAG: phage tail protein [Alphaproteobacteria bacterium]|nr:phage tail protein [Alphaproteobacteria bacterium]